MKKLHVIAGLIMVAVLGFATASPAGEASIFDPAEGWIIRAYTAEGITVFLEVRNPDNTLVPNDTIEGLRFNPATVDTNAASPDVSLSFDTQSATAYVLYKDASGNLQIATYPDIFTSGSSDTQPPTVGITAPSNGADVSGTVTLSANASDNVGVVGVQFKVDGNNVGAEDTTAPYSISWSSATVSNGSPTITAVARDAAGNSTTSAGVTVNVSNGGGGSNVDLVITRLDATSPSGAALKGWGNGVENNVIVGIKNNGSAASGPFKVKAYFSSDSNPDSGDYVLLTWIVSGLNGGQTQEQTFTKVKFINIPIHFSYYVVAEIDADNEVAESNEGNNVKVGPYINVSR